MRKMTGDEWREFLRAHPRSAKVAVTRLDGRPHVTPAWIDLEGEHIVFTTWHSSIKCKAIRRDGRVSICVDDDRPPFSFVLVDGTAEIDEAADVRAWAARLGGRYMGEERADEFARRNGGPGEVVVRVTPTRVIGEWDVAEPNEPD